MSTLFLAKFKLRTSRYMSAREEVMEVDVRLVRADNLDEAEAKLRKAVVVEDPYGFSYRIETLELTEVIE